ncbi:inositol monophosphatase family protein [Epibacterium ulvae]|uniref:inositol monophosphatase family protein n=1 Tax=Epibacterium ulvae TaxID=1156985 RepID=UPI0024908D29|nr:inositol monophosphatase [Epibacterium ulvae]
MQDRLTFIQNLSAEAGALAQDLRSAQGDGFVETKGHQDFVTVADRAVEELIRSRIAEAYPNEHVLGEEAGQSGEGPALWVVDPIDGTANYMRGAPDWAVSIAFVQDGIITHGGICAPDLNIMIWAEKGKGAGSNVGEVALSQCQDPKMALLMLGWSARQTVPGHLEIIGKALEAGMEYRRNGCAVVSLLALALGRAEAYWERQVNAWDVFAMRLILEEVGAMIISPDVLSFIPNGGPFLAVVPGLEEEMRAVIGAI